MSRNEQTVLMRLALRQQQRRTSGRAIARSIVVLGALAGVTLSAGTAYAFWTTTATGGGASAAMSLTVTASATAPAATITNQLYPGNVATVAGGTGGDLVATVTYTKGPALKLTSVVQAGPVSVDSAHATAGCSSDAGTSPNITTVGASGVYVGTAKPAAGSPPAYTAYSIPSGSQPTVAPTAAAQTVTVPFVLSMDTSSNNACQGATFSVPVTLGFSS